ncbi:hypothetical protein EJG51_013400 [Undibacterium piscinae]|uniref:Uncharacterized protein n=1 Tax=Undibacterium piscinae TaxID=2495591 RepID=A0A6M4A5Q9_9BURK|nr:hypothetical protein EJG51_013400 [Undibacterium piscinae]
MQTEIIKVKRSAYAEIIQQSLRALPGVEVRVTSAAGQLCATKKNLLSVQLRASLIQLGPRSMRQLAKATVAVVALVVAKSSAQAQTKIRSENG